MKVLSHEDDVLKNGYGAELAAIKREYYRICVGLVDDLMKGEGQNRIASQSFASPKVSTRTAVMALFGAMNWLYTWYNPRVDPDAATLAEEISDIFLLGLRGSATTSAGPQLDRPSMEKSAPRNGGSTAAKNKARK
jgi:Tetracyclin repressor-like, C-terminal domain